MKLYLVSQTVNNHYGTCDSMIVAAKNEEEARHFHPSQYYSWGKGTWMFNYADGGSIPTAPRSWALPSEVLVELIGTAVRGTKKGIVLTSFNAG